MERNDSQATRFRNLIIKHFDLSTDLQADPTQITAEELVQRAFAFAGDRVVSDRELLRICSEILEKLSETCQQKSEWMVWHGMWIDDFCRLKQFIIEHIDLPAGLTAEQLARKVDDHSDVRFLRDEEIPAICSDVLVQSTAGAISGRAVSAD
jgi:hypothetical protein